MMEREGDWMEWGFFDFGEGGGARCKDDIVEGYSVG